jgi:hypothetical protein
LLFVEIEEEECQQRHQRGQRLGTPRDGRSQIGQHQLTDKQTDRGMIQRRRLKNSRTRTCVKVFLYAASSDHVAGATLNPFAERLTT